MKFLKINIPGPTGRASRAGQTIEIPYLVFKNPKGDQRCVISGGVHGDEVNGIALVQRLIEYIRKNNLEEHLRGEIVVLPIVNLSGFEKHTRQIAYDKKDLNRCFNQRGKTASNIIANALEKNFYSKADIAIDCHDSGQRTILIPHTRVHRFGKKRCNDCTRKMAQAFGSKIIVERKGNRGMLAVEMMKKYELPVLTVEIGGALKVADDFLKQGLEGVINVLKYTRMLPGNPKFPPKQYYLRNRFGIPAKEAGLIKFKKHLGQRVHNGDRIGELYIPSKAKTIDLISPMCGILFSMQHVDSVGKDEIMYSILEDKKCHVRRRTTQKFEELTQLKSIKME